MILLEIALVLFLKPILAPLVKFFLKVIPLKMCVHIVFCPGSPSSMVHFSTPTMSRMPSLRQELLRLQHQMRVQSGSVQSYKKELTEQKNKMVEQRKINLEQEKKLLEQDRKLQEQSGIISEQNIRIDRLENSINDLNNRLATVYKRVSDSDVMADIAGPGGATHRRKCKKSNQEVQKITIKTRQKRKQECDLAEEACGIGKLKSLKRKKYWQLWCGVKGVKQFIMIYHTMTWSTLQTISTTESKLVINISLHKEFTVS